MRRSSTSGQDAFGIYVSSPSFAPRHCCTARFNFLSCPLSGQHTNADYFSQRCWPSFASIVRSFPHSISLNPRQYARQYTKYNRVQQACTAGTHDRTHNVHRSMYKSSLILSFDTHLQFFVNLSASTRRTIARTKIRTTRYKQSSSPCVFRVKEVFELSLLTRRARRFDSRTERSPRATKFTAWKLRLYKRRPNCHAIW